MHNSSNQKLKQQKGKPKMDGLARPGASKGVSKRSHFQNSSTSWIGEPDGQGTSEPRGLSIASTHESGGQCIREPGGLARPGASKGVSKRSHFQNSSTSWIGEPGGQGTGEPRGASTHVSGGPCIGGLSTRELGGPVTRGPRGPGGLSSQPIQKGQSYNWLQNEENRNSFSCQSPVTAINHGEEDEQEDTHETDYAETETDTSDDELEENMGSTSHGTFVK